MSKKRRKGRPQGSRNTGYFFRAGRGWFSKTGGTFTPLTDENGNRLRDPKESLAAVKLAVARLQVARSTPAADVAEGESNPTMTLAEVCGYYLEHARVKAAKATYDSRGRTLYDLCYGFPGRFWGKKDKPAPKDRIHGGYGHLPVDQLKVHHIRSWVNAHPDWTGPGIRTHKQTVKRALNFAAKDQLIAASPLKGMEMERGRERVAYIEEAQEEAILKYSCPAQQTAIKVLIRTGMRPGEFIALTAKHVKESIGPDGNARMEFRFRPEEIKTRKARTVYVNEPWLIERIRQQIAKFPTGPLFRNTYGRKWKRSALSAGFLRAVRKAEGDGVEFGPDTCLYSCRHTFAKRCLTGYWKGAQINIEILARLMGNSPAICRKNYLNWDKRYEDPLWAAC